MAILDSSKAINGTYGQVWLDDEEVMETKSFQAKIDIKKDSVARVGTLATGHKIISWEGKGTLKASHVTSRFITKAADNLKQGKATVCTIISKLEDPDAYGAERIALKNVIFDDITLADWEAQKAGEISAGFTFEDFELLDVIDPNNV